MSLLSISALAKSFLAGADGCTARVTVLRSIDLAMWPGELVALEGEPGRGRTTLLRCAAGTLGPDAGAIRWFGGRTRPGEQVTYLSACSSEYTSPRQKNSPVPGALHAQLERAARRACRIFLIDDLSTASPLEQRLILSALRSLASRGASALLAADPALACSPLISRALTLANGVLVQRRKRSAARMTSSSPASRARASARSTYGRSLRSPQ